MSDLLMIGIVIQGLAIGIALWCVRDDPTDGGMPTADEVFRGKS